MDELEQQQTNAMQVVSESFYLTCLSICLTSFTANVVCAA